MEEYGKYNEKEVELVINNVIIRSSWIKWKQMKLKLIIIIIIKESGN